MAILKSAEGKFYELSDDQLAKCEIPADEVKQKLEEAGCIPQGGGGPGIRPYAASPQVLIQVFGGPKGGMATSASPGAQEGVAPYHHCHRCHRCHRCHWCH